MKTYLSYGGGVNSTAMLLLLHDEGLEFESIYVDHGCDWPETREYVHMIAEKFPLTILKPNVEGFDNLYDYWWHHNMIPLYSMRFCTAKFKVRVIEKYIESPCFQYLGIASDEPHRAKLSSIRGAENRFPLIEQEIDREGCKQIIADHGLPIPMKSGCWFCMFQRVGEWKKLRTLHPDLFCKAQQLEARNNEYRISIGKEFMGLGSAGKKNLSELVNDQQGVLFKEMEYPPCHCGL